MRKIIAIATILMMASMTIPNTAADSHIATAKYLTGGAGVTGETGNGENIGYVTGGFAFGPESDFKTLTDYDGIAVVNVEVADPASNFQVNIDDFYHGGDGAMSACFFNPEATDDQNVCDDGSVDGMPDHGGTVGCGTQIVPEAPFATNIGTVFFFTLYVQSNGGFCGATEGEVNAHFGVVSE